MTQLLTRNRICEHLEKYVFDKVWNEPYAEYRNFIVPQLLNTVPAKTIFFGRYSQVHLPSNGSDPKANEAFYVYSIPSTYFGSMHINAQEWTTLASFCTDNLVDLELFHQNGRRAWRGGIYIRQADMNDCILLAVNSDMLPLCVGEDEDITKMYFGKYFDSDQKTSITYKCFQLTDKDLKASTDPIISGGEATYTLYDGKLLTGEYLPHLLKGAYIEKVFDENVLGIVDVQVTDASAPIYNAESVPSRLLVHIPKTVNTNHVVITPNTIDIYMVPNEMEDGWGHPELNGIYLYQCGRDENFHRITHNDFGIDVQWLKEIAEAHHFVSYYLKVVVRAHSKSKEAIRDANYINLLYTHSDEEIIDHLLDRASDRVEFWTANYLEDQPYAEALSYRRQVPPTPDEQCSLCSLKSVCDEQPKTTTVCPCFARRTIKDYVKIMGYYHTLALVGRRVTHFEVTSAFDRRFDAEFTVNAPVALADASIEDFFPVIYHNGVRLDQSLIKGVTSTWGLANRNVKELEFTDDQTYWSRVIENVYAPKIRIIVDKSVEFLVNDRVVVELLDSRDGGELRHFKNVTSITMETTDEWKVYRRVEENSCITYIRETNPGTFDEETMVLTLKEELTEDVDLVVTDGALALEESATFSVTSDSTEYIGKELWSDRSKMNDLPLDAEIVFLNGLRLIRGFDYAIENNTDDTKHAAAIYMQNVSFLKKENTLSVVRSTTLDMNVQRGFLHGNVIHWNHQNPFWFDELSILTINGKVCSGFTHDMGTLRLADEHRNGSPFEVRMSASRKVVELVNEELTNEKTLDENKIATIQQYFYRRNPSPAYNTVVPHAHKVYSLWLEQIISAYVTTSFDFQFYVSEQQFLEQFTDFQKWKNLDVVYQMSYDDLRYTDIYPIYNRLRVPSQQMYLKITALAKRLLPTDKIKHKDASNVK